MGYALELDGITKAFGPVQAVEGVTFRVPAQTVVALVGENGAGKSTLMNIAYGLLQPDAGRIRVDWQAVVIRSVRHAIELGIGMVHQHFMLVPALTVVQNVILGWEPRRGWRLDMRKAGEVVGELIRRYRFEIPLDVPVGRLPVGQQQKVEILKLLFRGATTLILDEPTAVLTPQETRELFANFRELTAQGKTVLLITHKLDEVMAISQQVVVLRRGRVVGELETYTTSHAEIARMMVGRDVAPVQAPTAEPRQRVFEISDLVVLGETGRPAVRRCAFHLRAGEILAIAGVAGNGQSELMEALAGLKPVVAGSIRLDGREINHLDRAARRDLGVAFIPEDRIHDGLYTGWSVVDNLIAGFHGKPPFAHPPLGWLDGAAANQEARELVERFGIKTAGIDAPISALSGGNQQKVVVAREISHRPRILLASEPTRGVDVGAIESIHQQLIQARDEGQGIILVSSDLDEVMTLGDRVAVMFKGRIVREFRRGGYTRDEIGLAMAGRTGSESP